MSCCQLGMATVETVLQWNPTQATTDNMILPGGVGCKWSCQRIST